MMRDRAIRRLIEEASKPMAADQLSDKDVHKLLLIADVYDKMAWLGRMGKASVPVFAVAVLVVSGWDRVVEAARALSGIVK
jgi:hypothetical protein